MSYPPEVTNIFCAHGFRPPSPEEIKRNTKDIIFAWGGVTVATIRNDLVIKYGPRVKAYEAQVLRFIRQHTTIPVPRVFSAFTYGPIADDTDEGSSTHTYIIMERVRGIPLDKMWAKFDLRTKTALCRQLADHVNQLRSIESPTYVGSLQNGPIADNVLENESCKGPFPSVAHFHHTLATSYAHRQKGHVRRYIEGILNTSQYDIKFTHSDLRQANILVRDDGTIAGIVDWEMAGWYPEYWEFVKMFAIYRFHDDWGNHILATFRPYFAESAAFAYVHSLLW